MPLSKEQIKAAAMQLDPADREALAEELMLSLSETEREAIDAAWLEEARQRHEAFLKTGGVAKPVDEVIGRLRGSAGR
jgi:hypothetical protein